MKITRFSLIVITALSVFSCQKKVNPFEIGVDHIGELTKTSTVKDLDKIYANDSIVKHIAGDEFVGSANEIEIYDKQGKPLLILEASQEFDSTATIKSIRVIDARFKTLKGFGAVSTFKDLKDNYTISKITNTLSSVLVDIDEINAYVAIDKKELPNQVQFDTKTKIEAVNIPDGAKIKYFWLKWE
ncbi:hypothetical protein [Aquimarina agarilytica]|uniref:hypothetical protein n=1 Tax=Aquimarina agarilytica TaxID=1087449 RepID=UPI000289B5AD|nr:hypothetical protein [Aquimarina agarilytica]